MHFLKMVTMMLLKILLFVTPALAYPDGAPKGACGDMYPTGHKSDAQTNVAPYTLEVNTQEYTAGDQTGYTVTLDSNAGVDFEGFFIQARRADCSSDKQLIPVGTFVPGSANYTTRSCGDVENSAITHAVKYHYKTVSFTWKPSADDVGPIYFRATVVQHEHTFWTDVTTNYVMAAGGATNATKEKCDPRTTMSGASTPHMILSFALLMSLLSLFLIK